MGQQAFGIGPVVQSAFAEMVNPGGITALVVFITFLYLISRDKGTFWRNTIGFAIGNCAAKFFGVLGIFDRILVIPYSQLFIAGLHLLFAFFCVCVGMWLLREWSNSFWGSGRDQSHFARKLDDFKANDWGRNKIPWTWRSLMLGMGLALLQTIWGNHPNLALVFLQLSIPGFAPAGFVLLFFHSFLLELPFVFFAYFVWGYLKEDAGRRLLHQFLSKVQIISAAIYSGFGISFLWVYGPKIFLSLRP